MPKVRIAALLLLSALPLAAQEGHGATPADIERGAQLYLTNCTICHGPEGDGVSGVNLGSNRFRHAGSDADLVSIVQKGIPGTPMPPGNYPDAAASALVAYLHAMSRPAPSILTGASPGDPARGRAIVEGKGNCLSCHRIDHRGSFAAPDLSEIGNALRISDLERKLVDPNAQIRTDSRTVRAVRKDGTVVPPSILLNQDTYTIQIIDHEGNLVSLKKSALKEFEIMKNSPMPSYKNTLSVQELADTVSYLVSKKGQSR